MQVSFQTQQKQYYNSIFSIFQQKLLESHEAASSNRELAIFHQIIQQANKNPQYYSNFDGPQRQTIGLCLKHVEHFKMDSSHKTQQDKKSIPSLLSWFIKKMIKAKQIDTITIEKVFTILKFILLEKNLLTISSNEFLNKMIPSIDEQIFWELNNVDWTNITTNREIISQFQSAGAVQQEELEFERRPYPFQDERRLDFIQYICQVLRQSQCSLQN